MRELVTHLLAGAIGVVGAAAVLMRRERGVARGRFVVFTEGRLRVFHGMDDHCAHGVPLGLTCDKCGTNTFELR